MKVLDRRGKQGHREEPPGVRDYSGGRLSENRTYKDCSMGRGLTGANCIILSYLKYDLGRKTYIHLEGFSGGESKAKARFSRYSQSAQPLDSDLSDD